MTLSPLRDLSIDRVLLTPGAGKFYPADNAETIIHVLIGTVGVRSSAGDFPHVGQRRVIFDGPPAALYLPPGCAFEVYAETATADVVVAKAQVPEGQGVAGAALIRPEAAPVHEIGQGYWQRTVYEVIGGAGPSLRLHCGETVNPPGHWSSWPMHREERDPTNAPAFEEVFFTFHDPVLPGLDGSETYLRRRGLFCDGTEANDVVLMGNGAGVVVPLGYHPICAPLDATLKYIWFYCAPWAKQYATAAEHGGRYA